MKRPVKIKAAAVYVSLLLIIAAAALFSAVHTCIGHSSGVTAAFVTDENASSNLMYRVTAENRNRLFLFYYKKPPD